MSSSWDSVASAHAATAEQYQMAAAAYLEQIRFSKARARRLLVTALALKGVAINSGFLLGRLLSTRNDDSVLRSQAYDTSTFSMIQIPDNFTPISIFSLSEGNRVCPVVRTVCTQDNDVCFILEEGIEYNDIAYVVFEEMKRRPAETDDATSGAGEASSTI